MLSGPTAAYIPSWNLLNQYTTLLKFLLRPANAPCCARGPAGLGAPCLNILDNCIRGLTSQLNVIVRKLAQLGIIHAVVLILLGCAQRQPWDEVHQEKDEARAAEGVGETCDRVGKLVCELDVVPVEPATWDDGGAVEGCYVITVGY